MVRTDLLHQQFGPTMRAELNTRPAVFDSGPAPLGYEAATPQPPPAPAVICRGLSCRQGRLRCLTPERCRAGPPPRTDNTDVGYRSRPVPLDQERPSPRMFGEAAANALAVCAVVALAVAAAWHLVARLAS